MPENTPLPRREHRAKALQLLDMLEHGDITIAASEHFSSNDFNNAIAFLRAIVAGHAIGEAIVDTVLNAMIHLSVEGEEHEKD